MADDKVKTTPQDFFLNLFTTIALYVSATSFGALLFQLVNRAFPDPLGYFAGGAGAMRFAVASLVVFFPAYLWGGWVIQKLYRSAPERRNTAARRWLVYFTLFAAGLIIVGDFVSLILRFLEGELTSRFVLKVLVVLGIAGAVLWYYLGDTRGKWSQAHLKKFITAAAAVVLAAAVGSFVVIGSPGEQRMRLFDEERVSDLQFLQSEIVYFWQAKDELPEELSEIGDDLRGVSVPTDPRTGEPYDYRVIDGETFELCATFETESDGSVRYPERYPTYFEGANWEHGRGGVCFERHIDPDFYTRENVVKEPVIGL